MFCQLEVLRHCLPPNVRRILDDLPESLDETYERVLREIRKPNQEHAQRLLQCLVAAIRPLKVEELAEVLAFDFDVKGIPKLNPDWRWKRQEEAIMTACSSLVIVVEDGDSRIVQFSHFSVKEFLTENRLAKPIRDVSRYHIQLDAAHTILAQACLGVLLRLDDRINPDNAESFPLACYAGRHVVAHAQFETVSSRIKDGMERLFDIDQPYFAIWVWLADDETTFHCGTEGCTANHRPPPLYYAAKYGFRDLAEHLITKHPDQMNARGWQPGSQGTPLHVAAHAGHIDILSLLIDHGVDVDILNRGNETPLLRALHSGKREAGRYLLDRGADINASNLIDLPSLYFVTSRGYVEFARMLLERGAATDFPNTGGETLLHTAVRQGTIELVRLLLERGFDPNLPSAYGETPSHWAVIQHKSPELVELLCEYGGDPAKPKPVIFPLPLYINSYYNMVHSLSR